MVVNLVLVIYKAEGRRQRAEGRRQKEEGRRQKEEGRDVLAARLY
jgi:hypothetical protein